jgi:hypothetical protein
MTRGKKHTAEQIVNLLRQVEVGVANGKTLPQACRGVEIVEQTYYGWRKEYGSETNRFSFAFSCSSPSADALEAIPAAQGYVVRRSQSHGTENNQWRRYMAL